ncbi:hypothetical protein [Aliivibrio fischeri]|uniref:hypothetical protein n=1 Tax=Aliivibrio fischeri TaxID=668 RepID=UPI001F4617F0|nr:hypothetical protein [Aliivibrio fischeri]
MKTVISLLAIIFSSLSFAYPMDDIYKTLDITSFSSSLMPKRMENEKHFSELNLPKPVITDSSILIESETWHYQLNIVGKDEHNLHVCFIDKALKGSYNAQSSMILRKYGNEYVAISMRSNACDNFAL